MTIEVKITADTPAEFARQMLGAVGAFVFASRQMQPAAPANDNEPAAETVQEAVEKPVDGEVIPPKRTRGRKPAAEAEGAKQVDLEQAIAEKQAEEANLRTVTLDAQADAPSDEPPATIEEVRAALVKLAKEKGDDVVWKLLSDHKAKSASAIPEGSRRAVIAEVEKQLGAS